MKKYLALAFFAVFLPVVSAQTADSLDSAVTRAEEARKIAGDFEGNAYFPGEWEAAEYLYASAPNVYLLDSRGPFSEAAESSFTKNTYDRAAAAFGRVSELAIPLYAQAREDEIMAIRGYLITLGARDSFPEYLRDADKAALLALTQYEAKDYYSARDSAATALRKYNVLETALNVWLLRQEIWERGFSGYEPDKFELGGEIISSAMTAYMGGNLAGAQEKTEEALSMYNLVLLTAWENYAELRSSLAEGERLAALDMKTNIAAREFFLIADSENTIALDLLEAKQYEDAAKLFINAEAMFVISSITTLERRRTANAAIGNANEKILESDRIARNAKVIKKGGPK
jgi:hypothetical protein